MRRALPVLLALGALVAACDLLSNDDTPRGPFDEPSASKDAGPPLFLGVPALEVSPSGRRAIARTSTLAAGRLAVAAVNEGSYSFVDTTTSIVSVSFAPEDESTLYVVEETRLETSTVETVRAFDASGAVRWRTALVLSPQTLSPRLVHGGGLLGVADDTSATLLDPANGAVLGSLSLPPLGLVGTDEGILLVSPATATVQHFGTKSAASSCAMPVSTLVRPPFAAARDGDRTLVRASSQTDVLDVGACRSLGTLPGEAFPTAHGYVSLVDTTSPNQALLPPAVRESAIRHHVVVFDPKSLALVASHPVSDTDERVFLNPVGIVVLPQLGELVDSATGTKTSLPRLVEGPLKSGFVLAHTSAHTCTSNEAADIVCVDLAAAGTFHVPMPAVVKAIAALPSVAESTFVASLAGGQLVVIDAKARALRSAIPAPTR